MRDHILSWHEHARRIPSKSLPDGAITGNGDVTLVLGETSDRVQVYIGKPSR